jgi:large subunit ribosomal protein L15
MMLHNVTTDIGARNRRKRVGRGIGSGHGKTSGRGHKGAGSRSGHKSRLVFEGGQMPLVRRLAKRGFNNRAFGQQHVLVCVSTLDRVFQDGDVITCDALRQRDVVNERQLRFGVKIVGNDSLTKKLSVSGVPCTRGASQAVRSAGGTVQ